MTNVPVPFFLTALPWDIGGLEPNQEYKQKLNATLMNMSEGAGVLVDNAGTVITVAETTHDVLQVALVAGGVTQLAFTAAEIAAEQGLAACARVVAQNLVAAQVAGYAAQQAVNLATSLGVDPDYIRIGADALQVVMLWRAARANAAGCFVAGTQVLTGYNPDGTPITRNIEDLRRGDLVMSRSESDAADDLDLRPLLAVSERTVYRLVNVDVADASGNIEHLATTAEHPFWVEGLGWTAAKDLTAGATLLDDARSRLSVGTVRIEDRPEGVAVYNLTVDADHTYFVEDGAGTQRFTWVHNAECKIAPKLYKGKDGGQMFQRGWKQQEIVDLVNNPASTSTASAGGEPLRNLATGNPAKAFIRSDGHGVLQDQVTGEVFHVSNKLDPNWVFYWPWPL